MPWMPLAVLPGLGDLAVSFRGEIVSKAGPCQVQAHYYALEYCEVGLFSNADFEVEGGSDAWNLIGLTMLQNNMESQCNIYVGKPCTIVYRWSDPGE